jgi:hypothetical protein
MVAVNVRCLDGVGLSGAHPYPGGWKKVVVLPIGDSGIGGFWLEFDASLDFSPEKWSYWACFTAKADTNGH